MATKTFDELKQMAIQIRDEKTNKQNTATRIGTQMLEHLNKLEQDFLDKDTTEGKFSELNQKVDSQKAEVDAARDEALQAIEENEQSAISNFNAQRVTPEMLSESTKQFIEASGGGTITNLADDEDIESKQNDLGINVLKFADRSYNPTNFSGKGYKILRKNIVDDKNILTQEMINEQNTVYEIRYDFDLNNKNIVLPKGCTLKIEGGSFKNGLVILNVDTKILGNINKDVISGSFINDDKSVNIRKNKPVPHKFIICKVVEEIIPESSVPHIPLYYTSNIEISISLSEKKAYYKYGGKYYKNIINNAYVNKSEFCNDDNSLIENIPYYDYTSENYYIYTNGEIVGPLTIERLNNDYNIPIKYISNISDYRTLASSGYTKFEDEEVELMGWSAVAPSDNKIDISKTSFLTDFAVGTVNPNANYSTLFDVSTREYKDITPAFLHICPIKTDYPYMFTKNNKEFRFNVANFGIVGDGKTDWTKKLNELFSSLPKGVNPIVYFPAGDYIISDTIYPFVSLCTVIGDGRQSRIIFLCNSEKDNNKFAIDCDNNPNAGGDIKNLSLICAYKYSIDNAVPKITLGYKIDRLAYGDPNLPSSENAPHHYHYEVKNIDSELCGMRINGNIYDCYIEGFPGVGACIIGGFKKCVNDTIKNCGIGISSYSNYPWANVNYSGDNLILNCIISYCGTGIITTDSNVIVGCWIDEILYNGITPDKPINYPSFIQCNYIGNYLRLTMHGCLLNHIDFCAISCSGKLQGVISSIFNRCGCYYAGRTIETLPELENDIKQASTIYAREIVDFKLDISMSNNSLIDGSQDSTRFVGVVGVGCDTIKGSFVTQVGTNNSDRGAYIKNKEESKSYILYTAKDGNMKKWNILSENGIVVE